MTDRRFPYTLIPPSINEPRTRALLDAFEAMIGAFDFSVLLQRNADETSTEALPLAMHDRSLEEFIGEDGLPEEAVRRLIDEAWPLHEDKGTDDGVALGLSLIGVRPHFEHWWQQEPEGPHDTHNLTVYVNEHLFDDEAVLLNSKVQIAALTMVDATKRWSQDTNFELGAEFETTLSLGLGGACVALAQPMGALGIPESGATLSAGTVGRGVAYMARVFEPVLPQLGTHFACAATARGHSFLSLHGELLP
ncbi:phage tail protein [Pseudovibrio sp. Tun.PSC04-5.I4]|uniref:phage tail protein n=1 Tax=Pseudovibrio sp. Tun.PSC04-5.I4 TaxID=1798213 RepID=UPI00088E09DD|nr:phage tail protein [Pseudovibrio sp. Tun.PSC04-5.I4]SDR15366.1 phage tail protein, P2 protein I family [Pseudovibrio sp. Tun.PSC04-5.I4]